jgi:hypothetical protein
MKRRSELPDHFQRVVAESASFVLTEIQVHGAIAQQKQRVPFFS